MFIIPRLVEALTSEDKAKLSSDPVTYALVYGGTIEEIKVALYHLFLYNQPLVVGNTILSSREFISWVDQEFSLSELFAQCGRGEVMLDRYGFRRTVTINGVERPMITFNS